MTRVTSCQAITFLAKKPSNFIKAYKEGIASVKETLTTPRGIKKYVIKKLGGALSNAIIVGETCPYLKDGYNVCTITRNSGGEVESLAGPNGRIFTRI